MLLHGLLVGRRFDRLSADASHTLALTVSAVGKLSRRARLMAVRVSLFGAVSRANRQFIWQIPKSARSARWQLT